MTKKIDYDRILDNADSIINALEYDCMRSGGKVKFNAATLNELYSLVATLEAKKAKVKKPEPKPTTQKEG